MEMSEHGETGASHTIRPTWKHRSLGFLPSTLHSPLSMIFLGESCHSKCYTKTHGLHRGIACLDRASSGDGMDWNGLVSTFTMSLEELYKD